VLLIALLGAPLLYLKVHQPMAADLAKFRSEQPQFERQPELKTRKDREAQETAWLAPTAEALRRDWPRPDRCRQGGGGVAGNRIVVNIAEGSSIRLIPSPLRRRQAGPGRSREMLKPQGP